MVEKTPIFDEMVTTDAGNRKTAAVQPKVAAATVGAGVGVALSTIVVWVIEATAVIDIPESVELAGGVVVTAGLSFLAGYFKRPSLNAS